MTLCLRPEQSKLPCGRLGSAEGCWKFEAGIRGEPSDHCQTYPSFVFPFTSQVFGPGPAQGYNQKGIGKSGILAAGKNFCPMATVSA